MRLQQPVVGDNTRHQPTANVKAAEQREKEGSLVVAQPFFLGQWRQEGGAHDAGEKSEQLPHH